jgi:tol-pal system protein YbgF
MTPKQNPSLAYFSAMVALVILFGQTGCLRSRLKTREGTYSDATPNSYSAPNSSDSAAASASSSYLIDELKAEIARLSGRIEDLERGKSTEGSMPKLLESRIVELEKTQLEILERLKGGKGKFPPASGSSSSISEPAVSETSPSSGPSAGLFDKGRAAHAAGKFEEAIESLDSYLVQSPKGKNVEEAIFLKGESLFLTKQYKSAIVDFSKISEKFPKSKRIPTALLKIGQSFEALGMTDDAKGFYQELVDRFPRSTEAKKAKTRLKG